MFLSEFRTVGLFTVGLSLRVLVGPSVGAVIGINARIIMNGDNGEADGTLGPSLGAAPGRPHIIRVEAAARPRPHRDWPLIFY